MSNSRNQEVDKELMRLEYSFDKGVNFKDRSVMITGEIGEHITFDHVDAALSELERDSRKQITLKINSPGGSVYEATAIAGRIKSSKCKIVTEGFGQIMSAATLILASGDRRKMSRYAMFMAHEASYDIRGRHSDVQDEVKQKEREEDLWARWMADMTDGTEDFWRNRIYKTDLYFDAEQCLEYGIVDEII